MEEADNWSKAGERFAPLNPAASFSEGATSRSGCFEGVSRTVTTIVSFRYTHTSDRYNRTITSIHTLTVVYPRAGLPVTIRTVTFHTWLNFCPIVRRSLNVNVNEQRPGQTVPLFRDSSEADAFNGGAWKIESIFLFFFFMRTLLNTWAIISRDLQR